MLPHIRAHTRACALSSVCLVRRYLPSAQAAHAIPGGMICSHPRDQVPHIAALPVWSTTVNRCAIRSAWLTVDRNGYAGRARHLRAAVSILQCDLIFVRVVAIWASPTPLAECEVGSHVIACTRSEPVAGALFCFFDSLLLTFGVSFQSSCHFHTIRHGIILTGCWWSRLYSLSPPVLTPDWDCFPFFLPLSCLAIKRGGDEAVSAVLHEFVSLLLGAKTGFAVAKWVWC